MSGERKLRSKLSRRIRSSQNESDTTSTSHCVTIQLRHAIKKGAQETYGYAVIKVAEHSL